MIPPKICDVYERNKKKNRVDCQKSGAVGSNLKLLFNGGSGRNPLFSRKFTELEKICRSLVIFGPIQLMFLQIIGKDTT